MISLYTKEHSNKQTMVDALPADFVERPSEFEELISKLLDNK